jgi:hypothetical protein
LAFRSLLPEALMPRLKTWPSRFAALVDEVRARPFAWGSHDCCLWAASAVLALTGNDPGADLRHTYFTGRAAARILVHIGGLEGAGSRTGPSIELGMATVGDVGLVTWPDGTRSLAVRSMTTWMVAGEHGLAHLPLEAASQAWGVGRE